MELSEYVRTFPRPPKCVIVPRSTSRDTNGFNFFVRPPCEIETGEISRVDPTYLSLSVLISEFAFIKRIWVSLALTLLAF